MKMQNAVADACDSTSPNPEGALKEELQLGVADARMGDVNGHPALITEPHTDAEKANPADVRFVVDGIEVNLFSQDYSTDDLIDVAATIGPDVQGPKDFG